MALDVRRRWEILRLVQRAHFDFRRLAAPGRLGKRRADSVASSREATGIRVQPSITLPRSPS
jgi:hypothetical protein